MIIDIVTSTIDGSIMLKPVQGTDAWDLFMMMDQCFPGHWFVACHGGYENALFFV